MTVQILSDCRGSRSNTGPVQPAGTQTWCGYLYDYNYFMTPQGLLVCDPLFVSGFIQATDAHDAQGHRIYRLYHGNELYFGIMPDPSQFQVVAVTTTPLDQAQRRAMKRTPPPGANL